jgi:hypothetical protein
METQARQTRKSFKKLIFDREGQPEAMKLAAERFERGLMRDLKRRGAKETSFLWFHVRRVSTAWLIVQNIEQSLLKALDGEPGLQNMDPKKDRAAALLEAHDKADDRWRKALKDLEDYLDKTCAPAGMSLADRMKPILKKAEGVLEEALEYEANEQNAEQDPVDAVKPET